MLPRFASGWATVPEGSRRAHAAGARQRLEKRHLPLDHELGLRRALVLGMEVGVEDDGVGGGSVGKGVHRFVLLRGEGNRVSNT